MAEAAAAQETEASATLNEPGWSWGHSLALGLWLSPEKSSEQQHAFFRELLRVSRTLSAVCTQTSS